MEARAVSRGWGLLGSWWGGPWLLACTTVAAGSDHGCMAGEVSFWSQARSMEVHSCIGLLQSCRPVTEMGSEIRLTITSGNLSVGEHPCGYRVSPQACTWQGRPVMRVGPIAFRCTAGKSSYR